jgi:hypothetical protein
MSAPAKVALALWVMLALAVFSVRFDWQTRMAGHDFVLAQAQRRAQGAPLETIENGFRPMVRRAALEASVWLLVIAAGGAGAVVLAARREAKDAF